MGPCRIAGLWLHKLLVSMCTVMGPCPHSQLVATCRADQGLAEPLFRAQNARPA